MAQARIPSINRSCGNCTRRQPSAIARQARANQVPPVFLAKVACNTKAEAELVEFERGVCAYVRIQIMCLVGAQSLELGM
jgi:hypothetical protein